MRIRGRRHECGTASRCAGACGSRSYRCRSATRCAAKCAPAAARALASMRPWRCNAVNGGTGDSAMAASLSTPLGTSMAQWPAASTSSAQASGQRCDRVRACRPMPNECIDQLGRRCGRHDVLNRSRPVGASLGRASRSGVHRALQRAPARPVPQAPRDHIAVAAIVAGTAQNERLALHARAPDDLRRALARRTASAQGSVPASNSACSAARICATERIGAPVQGGPVRCRRRHASPLWRRDASPRP